MSISVRARRIAAILSSLALVALAAGTVSAHEERTVAGYDLEVGLIDEPVAVGERSGLEFFVHKGDAPVTGLESRWLDRLRRHRTCGPQCRVSRRSRSSASPSSRPPGSMRTSS
jgi:hypothetical protein